jgi:hypothetical protein
MTTNLYDNTNVPTTHFIAKPITSSEITAESLEVSPGFLNFIYKDQFGASASVDASMHHDFYEICDMQKFRNIDNTTLKLKIPLFIKRKSKRMVVVFTKWYSL